MLPPSTLSMMLSIIVSSFDLPHLQYAGAQISATRVLAIITIMPDNGSHTGCLHMQHLLLAMAQVGHDSSSDHKQILVPFPALCGAGIRYQDFRGRGVTLQVPWRQDRSGWLQQKKRSAVGPLDPARPCQLTQPVDEPCGVGFCSHTSYQQYLWPEHRQPERSSGMLCNVSFRLEEHHLPPVRGSIMRISYV